MKNLLKSTFLLALLAISSATYSNDIKLSVKPYSYKKFTKVTTELSYDTIYVITENLVRLKTFFNKVDEYKNSIPQETVKKLSLFK